MPPTKVPLRMRALVLHSYEKGAETLQVEGRMLVRLGQRFGIAVVCVVRRAEQVELLKSLGATHVLNSADPQFDA
jgi:D-arabinose 1-dehydrogenase-like Zn-dependent alcohol dehydrogenase